MQEDGISKDSRIQIRKPRCDARNTLLPQTEAATHDFNFKVKRSHPLASKQ